MNDQIRQLEARIEALERALRAKRTMERYVKRMPPPAIPASGRRCAL